MSLHQLELALRVALCTALCIPLSAAQAPPESSIYNASIVPDLIDSVSSTCSANITVSFGATPVMDGELIAPADAAATPNVTVVQEGGSASGGLFTLVAVDPDAPDPANPTRRSILHYLVTNIPVGGMASDGTEVTPWAGPRPPSGTHRYVFLAYAQPGEEPLDIADPQVAGGGRSNFSVRAFQSEHQLGQPCGVAWFLSSPM